MLKIFESFDKTVTCQTDSDIRKKIQQSIEVSHGKKSETRYLKKYKY